MVLDQQALEIALQTVTQQLSRSKLPGLQDIGELAIYLFDSLSSTNQTLWELLDRGTPPPTVVIAAQQTAGRGQWGRQWQSEQGGLYLSLALTTNVEASNSAQLTMCSAWGIATALRCYGIPVLIKWHNDLLLLGYKLGGILTETRLSQGQITKAVIGVGINWSNPVPETGINLQSFFATQPMSPSVTSLEMLAAIVIQGLRSGYHYGLESGIDNLRLSYQRLLFHQGVSIQVNGHRGIVKGVTSTGDLRVSVNSAQAMDTNADTIISPEIHLKPGTISLGYSQDLP
ncbi:biotin-(acetyl-CoA-carboxylase) ligase [Coleofasciculus chthonoplastes PCC 7420]|uniref:Biotin-(Acetyl-CoA-carboxylase) ligase n=1 Tax=Coleofasciculus chthonoplastes PCC 7420 TaxID=118168 RepID=B4VXX4_9CYAN|nr:biotin--[acetyl-CoA-carboxylase] ligase [Coleofasciculus chthonoplastes]EDX73112.1 biotin-(acetyl-CoA-carboxylase) ligase [Coleofasciculus chthonoplastes PCC 7420]